MNNGLLYLGGLLVLVFSALFAVPNFVDWNGYRGVFEEEASKVLGRDVRVGGAVNLKLLPVPYVRFEKVRIANVSGATGEPFVRAESFTMWLSGPALLRGVFEASEVELNKPELTLAVDANGGGNWTNIEFKPGDMPFVPRDVTLKSVRLIDGAVAIYNADNERIARLDAINGELSADGLRGPFRFKGFAGWSGKAHDVSFATASPDADGAFGIKASARVQGSANNVLLDGRVSGVGGKPTFTGDLTASVAVPGIEHVAKGGDGGVPVVDFKSQLTADTLQARFDNIALTLDNAAEPQTITGSATAAWKSVPSIDVALASKWLDLDRLSDAGQGGASFARLKKLAFGLLASVAGDGAASAKINLEQVKVGGETAGGLYIDARRGGGKTHFNKLSASLPGNSRLEFVGDLKDEPGKFSFAGTAAVSGANLARLKSWAERSGLALDVTADGPFSADGNIDIGETRVAITDASAVIAGHNLSGDVVINNDTRHSEIKIAAGHLDTRMIFPKAAKALRAKLRLALGLPGKDASLAGNDPLGDTRLRVFAAELTDGGENFRDVDLKLESEGSEVRLASSKITTSAGLELTFDGRVKTAENGQAKGTLAFDLSGSSAEAVRELATRIGIDQVLGADPLKNLREAKIAGLLRLGIRTPLAADAAFDGTLNGAHFKGVGEFDQGLNDWKSGVARLQATSDAGSLGYLLKLIGRETRTSDNGAKDTPAQVSLVATGVPASGMETRIDVTAANLAASFSGQTSLPDNAPIAADGVVSVKAAEVADALALSGITLPTGSAGVSLDAKINVTRAGGVWKLAADDAKIGGSKLTASAKVAAGDGGAPILSGEVKVDRLVLPPLLAALADAPQPGSAQAQAATGAISDPSIWSEGLFDFATLGGAKADVKLMFQSLVLSGNLATADGAVKIDLQPGKLAAKELMANAAGGLLTGDLSLEKKSDGVALATKLKLEDAKLQSLSSSAKGKATFDLTAVARAQSPAGLFAVLTGDGRVSLTSNAAIPGPDAEAVSKVADSVLHAKLQNDVRAIAPALATALASSRMPVSDLQLAIKIADGVAKFDSVESDGAPGSVATTMNVDLSSLNLNASSQVAGTVQPLPPSPIPLPDYTPPEAKGPLPPVVVLYSGRLDDLTKVATSVDAGEMQRELAVRQMERNVQQLDMTRRLDQERFRLEKERRRVLEEQRLEAIAAERAKREAAKSQAFEPAPFVSESPPAVTTNTTPPSPSAPSVAAVPPTPAPPPVTTSSTPPAAEQLATPAVKSGAAAAPLPPPAASEALPPAAQPDAPQANAPGDKVLTPKITIEPIGPPSGEQAVGDAGAIPADPAAAAAAAPAPIPRPYAPKSRQQSRTSSDEIMKSLGGFP